MSTEPIAPASPPRHDGAGLAFNLAGMALLAAFVALGAAYLLDGHMRATPAPAETGTVKPTISGRQLDIPLGWLRNGEIAESGFSSQVELSARLAVEGLAEPVAVEVTLLPRSRVRPGAVMLDSVYLHQFAPETLPGPPGLVGKPLLLGPTLPGETVWYDPLAANPFVAKCQDPVAPGEPARCLRALILPSGIGAVYAFEDTALAQWRAFDAETTRMMATIGAW